MADSRSQLTADLDRLTGLHGSTALLCGVAAGFAAGGLFGAWLASRRHARPPPRVPPLPGINTGTARHNAPSELGSLPVTPRTEDGSEHSEVRAQCVS